MAGKSGARPVFHPEIAADLLLWRGKRSARQILNLAHAKKHKALTANILRSLEDGKNKTPKPAVIRALADVYGVQYEALAWRFISRLYGIEPDFKLPPLVPQLSADVVSTARIVEKLPTALRASVIAMLDALAVALRIDR